MGILRWAAAPLLAVMVLLTSWRTPDGARKETVQGGATAETLRFVAVGDVNLGRKLGQKLLAGDTLYPWVDVVDTFARYDVVFANLESNISDQGGVTEDRRSNVVFTAPPAAAMSLKRAGVTVVSTANNHTLDFGVDALRQTVRFLDAAGVRYAGTIGPARTAYTPAITTVHGIRMALFACTDVMNGEGTAWKQYVAAADTAALLPALRAVRDSVDFIVVSYHGGDEYADAASPATIRFARQVLTGGADLFLGHHPHVPYGIERVNGKLAVHSLGNFVFLQSRYWTRRSFAIALDIVKDSTGTSVRRERVLPVLAGFQPRFIDSGEDAKRITERIRLLSSGVSIP